MITQDAQALEKLQSLLKGANVCMLTTEDEHDNLRSRPMALQESDLRSGLWFFTARHSPKINEIKGYRRVNVSVINGNNYVSISGSATLVDDKNKAKQLWSPAYKAWFPKGLDDPELILLNVSLDQAEYWSSPGGPVTTLIGFVKSLTTGEQAKVGENRILK